MRLTRIHVPSIEKEMTLDEDASGHLLRVLRLKKDDQLKVFNGKGEEYLAQIIKIAKKNAIIHTLEAIPSLPESPLFIHLAQSISRGEKMDYSLQKSVELGVMKITPLITERGGVKLTSDRLEKKMLHWQKIIIHASEQCGRSYLPTLMPIQYLENFLDQCEEEMKLVLAPSAHNRLSNMSFKQEKISLLLGPEGGLSDQEIALAKQSGFLPLQLGPRILRTETAGPTAIAALQSLWGDLR